MAQLIPPSVMPHIRRFGWSGAVALAVVVVMLLGINPVTILTGKVSPPPPPTSITGVPPAAAEFAALAAYPPVVGGEAELMWRRAFWVTALKYPVIAINVVPDRSEFGCGLAGKDLGTFYCPENQTVYVDADAYARLRDKFPLGADYAQAYLVAEAYGHHVQKALGALKLLDQMRVENTPEEALAFEKRLDMQAACYAGMWTITAGIPALYDNKAVLAALAEIEANRDRAILNLPAWQIIPETLTEASLESRKVWYDVGYAIPAGGNCSLAKIEAKGIV
jgi:predicted metalloprotease